MKLLVIHTDITDKVYIQRRIIESENKFRTLFNNAYDAIALFEVGEDLSIKFLEVNDNTVKRYGYSKEEMINMSVYKVIAPSEWEKAQKMLTEMLKSKKSTFDSIHITKNGDIIPVETSNNIFEVNGKKVMLAVARDITDRIETEKQLKEIIRENKELLDYAIKSEKMKTDFFCNISHEFKTPLNIILGLVQLFEGYKKELKDFANIQKFDRHVSILRQNCYRILRLVNNILEMNKIDANYLELNSENRDIIGLIREMVLSVSEFVENKGLSIEFEADIEERIIACDAYKIERIILNLLSNAVKYSRENSRINVKLDNCEDYIIINIKDTGRGIPENKVNTIFNRFTQVDSSLTRQQEGSGIGLSIVKSFVEMHGGEVWVKSEVNVGTDFFIKLPATVATNNTKSRIEVPSSSLIEKISIEFSDIYSS